MAFVKVSSADIITQGIQSQPDALSGTATEKKLKFDALATRVAERLNAVIDRLTATTADNSGADNIGSAPIENVNGATIRLQLVDLKSQLDGLLLEELVIPDGSIVKAKLADFNGYVGESIMTGYEKPASTSALSALDTYLQALGKLEKSIEDLNTSINNLSTGLSAGTTIPAKSADVTTNLNGVALTSIFETGGMVAKNATAAVNDIDGNAIKTTYMKTDNLAKSVVFSSANVSFDSLTSLGSAPTGKNTSDIIGLSFIVTPYSSSQYSGFVPLGTFNYCCVSTIGTDYINIGRVRGNIYVTSGIIYMTLLENKVQQMNPTNWTLASTTTGTLSLSDIRVFFK